MTNEILEQDWKKFFNEMSRSRLEWQIRVEVLKDDIGAQILSEGLPLLGFMLEERADGNNSVEVILGESSGAHQTHTIFNPRKVFFKNGEKEESAIIEIEDESGAKTIIYLIQPIPVVAVHQEARITAHI